jgi:hypothetical protein
MRLPQRLLPLVCVASAAVLPAHATVRVVDLDVLPVPFALVSVGSRQAGATDSSGRTRVRESLGLLETVTTRRIGSQPFSGPLVRDDSLAEFVVVLAPVVRGLHS